MAKRERKILPYVNQYGDTINPGETVYVVTTCTHRTRVNKCEYIGFVERMEYDYKSAKYASKPYVQVRVPSTRLVYYDKLTNEKWDWSMYSIKGADYYRNNVEARKESYDRISTLQHNRILPANIAPDRLMEAI